MRANLRLCTGKLPTAGLEHYLRLDKDTRTGDKIGGIAEGEGSRGGEGGAAAAAAAAAAVAAHKNLTTPWEGNLFIGDS